MAKIVDPKIMLSPESYSAVYSSPLGTLGIQYQQNQLTRIDWLNDNQTYAIDESKCSSLIIKTLDSYFAKGYWKQDISCLLTGSDFQKRVWTELKNIPFGETRTYGDLAKVLDTSSRAIGQACRTNPIPIVIPCHRVVARDHIGGFMGKAKKIHIKEWLLNHEAQYCG